ncbi:MAG: hypothetical protein LAO20_16665 [Acidobacteriia bacterium]|nr:hypothetical protein [Terriglobia bacterium]
MSIKSSVVIAKLLCSEGFTDHLGNQIEKYWKTSIMRGGARRKIARLEKEFSDAMTAKLDMKERLLLGRFIALHKRMSFDTALRIGLQAFQMKCPESGRIFPSATSVSPWAIPFNSSDDKSSVEITEIEADMQKE